MPKELMNCVTFCDLKKIGHIFTSALLQFVTYTYILFQNPHYYRHALFLRLECVWRDKNVVHFRTRSSSASNRHALAPDNRCVQPI